MAGNAPRYFFLFLIGLVAGVIGTVMAMRALDARKDHFHESVMHVQQWHLAQLKTNAEQNKCGAIDTIPHLLTLRTMANDIEPAFPDLHDEKPGEKSFVDYAGQLRASLDGALASPPLSCESLDKTVVGINEACKACHQDFRN